MRRRTAIRRRALGILGAAVVSCAFACSHALAAQRIAIDGSDASVELPEGWSVVPATGETPFVMLNLCDPTMTDGCLVRAELMLEQMTSEQMPHSLDDRLAQWQADSARNVVVAPAHLAIGGRDSIESVIRGAHSDHIQKEVFFDTILLREGDRYYTCSMTMNPPDYIALKGVLHDFCASLRFTTAQSG
jgi:hypothetical protein